MSCLYILEINPLSAVSFAIIISLSEWLFFHLAYSFLCCTKAFTFNQVPLVYFCFYFHYSRRWVIEDLALIYVIECFMSSSKSFIVPCLTFTSLIHCEFIYVYGVQFSSVEFSHSVVSDSSRRQASLSITNSQSSLRLTSIESVMPSNHLILYSPLLLPPSIFHIIRVFYNDSVLRIRWPKHWSFSFSISPSNEYSGLISFRMDWLDLLPVQGTLKSLLQHQVQKHQFFGTQFSLWSNSHINT